MNKLKQLLKQNLCYHEWVLLSRRIRKEKQDVFREAIYTPVATPSDGRIFVVRKTVRLK
jgi:hypothetical protein